MARRYSRGASKDVERAMHKRKRGTLKSGRSGKTVRSRKQAIAIGLSEARKKGEKVPASIDIPVTIVTKANVDKFRSMFK